MLVSGSPVLLFPGQGAYDERVLPALAQVHPQVSVLFAAIDSTAARLGGEPAGGYLLCDRPPSLKALMAENPDLLQLAIYGTSVVLSQIARAGGVQANVLLGHSFGEISALVVGGAYTVEEGAEVVLRRNAVLRETAPEPGAMLALGTDRERVERILDVLGDPFTVVAVENEPRQTVVSGPRSAIDAVAGIAAALRITTRVLSSPYPFHSPLVARGVAELSRQLRHLPGDPLLTPVYSPMLGRYLRPDDHLGEHVARALVTPVRFLTAVRRLHDDGARTFLECGAGNALSSVVQRCLPGVMAIPLTTADGAFTTLPPFAGNHGIQPVSPPAPAHADETSALLPPPAKAITAVHERADLFAEMAAMYAAALEYPPDVFIETVALEADLGIDSMKQTELLARAADRHGLPAPPPDFRLGDYDTMGKVVDYLWSQQNRPSTTTPARADEASAPVGWERE